MDAYYFLTLSTLTYYLDRHCVCLFIDVFVQPIFKHNTKYLFVLVLLKMGILL